MNKPELVVIKTINEPLDFSSLKQANDLEVIPHEFFVFPRKPRNHGSELGKGLLSDVIRVAWLNDVPKNVFFVVLGSVKVGAKRFLIGIKAHEFKIIFKKFYFSQINLIPQIKFPFFNPSFFIFPSSPSN